MFFSGNYSYAAILYMFFCLFFKVNVQRTFNEHRLLVSWGRFFYFIPIPREMVGEIMPTLLSLGWCDFWFTPPGFDQHILRGGEHQSSRNGFPKKTPRFPQESLQFPKNDPRFSTIFGNLVASIHRLSNGRNGVQKQKHTRRGPIVVSSGISFLLEKPPRLESCEIFPLMVQKSCTTGMYKSL